MQKELSNGSITEKVMVLSFTTKKMRFCPLHCYRGDGFKSLDENQSVEFEIMEGNRGLQAAHVKNR